MSELSNDVVNAVLSKGCLYEVGGVVRDRLLNQTNPDHDRDYVVTGIPYEELTGLLEPFGSLNLVGRSFGVIKFTQFENGNPVIFDITLPRTEFSTGTAHTDFEVKYDPSLTIEEDLSRRDFTINAMAWDMKTQLLVDPLNGRSDIEKSLIRIVYPESFKDDPLRIMRAVQFAARFELMIEPETFKEMKSHAELIKTVSPERINEELNKLLVRADNPSIGFRLMNEVGLLEYILPELAICVGVEQPGPYHAYDVFEHTIRAIDATPKKLRLRLSALFHDINKPQAMRRVEDRATFYGHEKLGSKTARRVMKRLRYGNEITNEVETLVDRHMFTTDVSPKGMRRLIQRTGVELIFDLLDLRRADVVAQGKGGTTEDVDQFEQDIRDELDRKPPFSVNDLQIGGKEIMELFSLPPGPKVGEILKYLLEQVLDDPTQNNEEKLRQLATTYYTANNIDTGSDKDEDTQG